jgi:hypothetical protein
MASRLRGNDTFFAGLMKNASTTKSATVIDFWYYFSARSFPCGKIYDTLAAASIPPTFDRTGKQ